MAEPRSPSPAPSRTTTPRKWPRTSQAEVRGTSGTPCTAYGVGRSATGRPPVNGEPHGPFIGTADSKQRPITMLNMCPLFATHQVRAYTARSDPTICTEDAAQAVYGRAMTKG